VADETDALLREIRDAQRALLEEYRRVANESLSMQREAFEAQKRAIEQQRTSVEAQLQYGRIYRVVLLVLLQVIGFVIWMIVRLSSRVL